MDFSSLNPVTSNALNLAARTDDVKTVRRLLKKLNPNCIDNRGWTCLHEAAAHGSYQSLLLILKHPDCRPLAETHEGHTALYLACQNLCSIQIIKALLISVKDIANYGSTECVTPLHVVCSQGRLDVIQLLIEYGAMIDVQDFDGDTPLHDAVLEMQHAAVNALLHAGANPEIKNESNYTPFHLASFKGCLATIENLFPFITDINEVTLNGDTPLTLATQSCNIDIVHFLLDHGANPHIRNCDDCIALDEALKRGYPAIFKKLLTVTSKKEMRPDLILRACKPHIFKLEILEDILYYDLGPEFFDFTEQFHVILEQIGELHPVYLNNAPLNSLLHICEYVYDRSPSTFRSFFYIFLMNGVNVNALEPDECPPLVYIHYTVHALCFKHIFEILLEYGCNVDYCSVKSKETRYYNVQQRNNAFIQNADNPLAQFPDNLHNYYCIPDAFIASLTSDPATAPIMMPYSLLCEPGDFLQFANDTGLLYRIPAQIQHQLLSMIDDNEEFTAEMLSVFVPPLKHLARLQIRIILKISGIRTTKQFFDILDNLEIPRILKNYLRYL